MKRIRYRGNVGTLLLVVFCMSLAALTLQTGCAEKETDPAKALLVKAVKAMGGEKRATAWTTRINKGHLTSNWPGWGELHANCTEWVKKPDKMKLDQDYSAYDHPFFFTYYYNGGEVWMMVNLGVRQNQRYTDRLTQLMRTIDGVAYYASESDTCYLVTDVPDDSLVTAADIARVGVVDEGDTVLFDLSTETHLPVRRIEGGGSMHVFFDDYRKTGGLTVPFRVTVYQNGAVISEYQWEEIEFNKEIDDAIFDEYRPEPTPETADEPTEESTE
ncbi:MAG: hypothetical protein JSW58_10340 [Candidatus Latescibacterota bacterium]|nr:MAG: hypothetical protein JSW58_10340 [Candidatus Latescibacterota bacterium]